MEYIERKAEATIRLALGRGKSVLLLGPRQTGKTTLLNRFKGELTLSLLLPEVRQRYEKTPSLLAAEVKALPKTGPGDKPLVFLDEVQKVPALLDVAQDLIDRKLARFILTGSSARKLRSSHANLLPGRVVALKLDPLSLDEWSGRPLMDWLLDGALPGIAGVSEQQDREVDLASYVTTYLEEEIRAEAIVRNVGPFARFLEYAASESGGIVNARKLSQEIGVSHTTVLSYFQILEDCLIIERVEPISKSRTRKKLTKTQKYLFFDLGVRRVAAHEGRDLPREKWGQIFEQFIGLELIKLARIRNKRTTVKFWRDPDGPEVDWVLEKDQSAIPIEVKWTEAPSEKDARHLSVFLKEHKSANKGYIVCQTPRRFSLGHSITALPWQDLPSLFD